MKHAHILLLAEWEEVVGTEVGYTTGLERRRIVTGGAEESATKQLCNVACLVPFLAHIQVVG